MARIRSKSETSRRITWRACPARVTPLSCAAAVARASGALPTCQEPVPAESSSTRSLMPSSAATARITPSAVGERQMLPRQTNSSLTGSPSSPWAPRACGSAARGTTLLFLSQLEDGEECLLRDLHAPDLLHPLLAFLLFGEQLFLDRKSTRLNSSHPSISYAVFC